MKKYKGWEIAKLISEGKLEGRTIQKVRNSHGIACKDLNMLFVVCEMVFYKNGDEGGSSFLTNGKVEFIILQEPVTFMDCVNSDKLVRVEHESLKEGGFSSLYRLDVLIFHLTNLGAANLKKVILEGKWYLDDEN